jgi:hypothetical protein
MNVTVPTGLSEPAGLTLATFAVNVTDPPVAGRLEGFETAAVLVAYG